MKLLLLFLFTTVVSVLAELQGDTTTALYGSHLSARTKLDGSCTLRQRIRLKAGLKQAGKIARVAAAAALDGHAELMIRYFQTATRETRTRAADRFLAIARECEAGSRGTESVRCEPRNSGCPLDPDRLTGYYLVRNRLVTICDAGFALPITSSVSGAYTLSGLLIHELSHAPIYEPRTDDLLYGQENVRMLNTEESLLNADTYQWFGTDAWIEHQSTAPSGFRQLQSLTAPDGCVGCFFFTTRREEGPSQIARNNGIIVPRDAGADVGLAQHYANGAEGHGYVSMHTSVEDAIEVDIYAGSLDVGWIHAVQPSEQSVNATVTLGLANDELPRPIASIGGVPIGNIHSSVYFEFDFAQEFVPNPSREQPTEPRELRLTEPQPQLAGLPADDPIWQRSPWNFYSGYSCSGGGGNTKRQVDTCPRPKALSYSDTYDEIKGRGTGCYRVAGVGVSAALTNIDYAGTADTIYLSFQSPPKLIQLFDAAAAGSKVDTGIVTAKTLTGAEWLPSYYFQKPSIWIKAKNRDAPEFQIKGFELRFQCYSNDFFETVTKYEDMRLWLGGFQEAGVGPYKVWDGELAQADF